MHVLVRQKSAYHYYITSPSLIKRAQSSSWCQAPRAGACKGTNTVCSQHICAWRLQVYQNVTSLMAQICACLLHPAMRLWQWTTQVAALIGRQALHGYQRSPPTPGAQHCLNPRCFLQSCQLICSSTRCSVKIRPDDHSGNPFQCTSTLTVTRLVMLAGAPQAVQPMASIEGPDWQGHPGCSAPDRAVLSIDRAAVPGGGARIHRAARSGPSSHLTSNPQNVRLRSNMSMHTQAWMPCYEAQDRMWQP